MFVSVSPLLSDSLEVVEISAHQEKANTLDYIFIITLLSLFYAICGCFSLTVQSYALFLIQPNYFSTFHKYRYFHFGLSLCGHTIIPVRWRLSLDIGKDIETMNHYREKWELLLSERRHSDIGPVFDHCGGNPFENDYGRLVMSAPVRRLQDKTQLFPLERSTYIRTRLTHSLEVSYVAGLLGQDVEKMG